MIKTKNYLINFVDKPLASIDYLKSNYATNIDTKWIDIINKNKIVIINKYFTVEGKINSLIEIISKIDIDEKKCSLDQIKLIEKIEN